MAGSVKKRVLAAGAVVFWLAVWQVVSMAVGQALILPSPASVAASLWGLVFTGAFWGAVGRSLLRIALGFFIGLVLGVALAWGSAASKTVDTLLRPLMQLIRATPVASFIILALFWFTSGYLSVFVSVLIVLPVLYTGTLTGIRAADGKLLEMADVFYVGFGRRLRAIYLPALRPSFLAACELGLGMCWKSGIAAEVIGLPSGTIGERMYQAKIFLMMPEMFAWTAVIILLSWLFARVILWLFHRVAGRLERGAAL